MTHAARKQQMKDFQQIDVAAIHLMIAQNERRRFGWLSPRRMFWGIYNALPHYVLDELTYDRRFSGSH